jgi:hypothetical protein
MTKVASQITDQNIIKQTSKFDVIHVKPVLNNLEKYQIIHVHAYIFGNDICVRDKILPATMTREFVQVRCTPS